MSHQQSKGKGIKRYPGGAIKGNSKSGSQAGAIARLLEEVRAEE